MPTATVPAFIVLHSEDNIAVAARNAPAGTTVALGGLTIASREPIDLGHKVATRAISRGKPVRKFGQTIGFASADIPVGAWVHTHNCEA
ncbi:MAG: altronate dehydratase, partial [Planctomycetaceae bacterium]